MSRIYCLYSVIFSLPPPYGCSAGARHGRTNGHLRSGCSVEHDVLDSGRTDFVALIVCNENHFFSARGQRQSTVSPLAVAVRYAHIGLERTVGRRVDTAFQIHVVGGLVVLEVNHSRLMDVQRAAGHRNSLAGHRVRAQERTVVGIADDARIRISDLLIFRPAVASAAQRRITARRTGASHAIQIDAVLFVVVLLLLFVFRGGRALGGRVLRGGFGRRRCRRQFSGGLVPGGQTARGQSSRGDAFGSRRWRRRWSRVRRTTQCNGGNTTETGG